jgi:hypothetical protein
VTAPTNSPIANDSPDDTTSIDDLLAGLRELDEHEADYRLARAYVRGEVDEHFASRRMARQLRHTGTRYKINVAKKAVTAVTDRLEITAIEAVGATGEPDAGASEKLREAWDANEMPLEAPLVHRKTCELGDGYVFVWPGDQAGTVEIEYSGPLTTRAIYDEESPKRIKYVIKRWTIGHGPKKRMRVNLYYFDAEGDPEGDDRIERWVTLNGTKGTDPAHWTEYDEDGEAAVIPNPWGQIAFHFRTDRPYGIPLHYDAYGPQDAINKVLIAFMSNVDFTAAPQRYALTDGDADDAGDDFDDDFEDAETGADPGQVDPASGLVLDDKPASKLESGPGKLWWLTGVKAVGEFPPATPDTLLNPAEFFLRLMAVTTDTPIHFFDPGGDQPSGDARRTAEGTLVKKIGWLQLSFEATWSALGVKVLKMLGVEIQRVHITWAPAAQADDLDAWQTAAQKVAVGVPVEQVLLEMGYTDEQVAEWTSNAEAKAKAAQGITQAGQLAGVLRDLGTAQQMGTVTPETVQQLIAQHMGNGGQPIDGRPFPSNIPPNRG